jgi:sugar phosphate isomerase/epimerase
VPSVTPQPVTLFTGQWTDLPLEEVAWLASGWGYDGLEIACSGEHLDVWHAAEDDTYVQSRLDILDRYGLKGLGDVPWEDAFPTLRQVGYDGPISVEWEDAGMDRLHGAEEAQRFVRSLLWKLPAAAFDAAFSKNAQ